MKKQTSVNQIEITQSGGLQIRMTKEIIDDDGSVLSSEYHRTAVECGGDVSAQMSAVNAHLATMGWPAVSAEDIGKLQAISGVVWTPTKVAAFDKAQASALIA